MTLIFINRFYWPEEPATAQLLTDLAEALAVRGLNVDVITSHPGGTEPPEESRKGVHIHRVRGTRLLRRGVLGKALDFATFYIGAVLRLVRIARRGDTVIALTDPPLLGIGIWLAARLRGARVLHWIQDIYPEIAITLTGHRWLGLISPLRNLAWRRADACVTLGSDMAGVLRTAGVPPEKITIIPNWGPAGLSPQPPAAANDLRADWGLVGKFVVLYSGNLGRVHDLVPVLDLAEQLRPHPKIALVLVGSGAQRAALKAEATRRQLPNLHFHPPQPRAQLARSLALGDLHLVTLRPGCETAVFPSKLYGIAAIGRPILFIGPSDCELAGLVRQHGVGLAFTRDAIPAMAASIYALSTNPAECTRLGAAAAAFAAESGNAEVAARRWAALALPTATR